MVEHIVELETNPELPAFPVRNSRVFHDGEVRIRIARSAEPVAKASRESTLAFRRHEVGVSEAWCCGRRSRAVGVHWTRKLRVNERPIVVASQIAGCISIKHCKRQPGVIEDGAGNLPSIHQR